MQPKIKTTLTFPVLLLLFALLHSCKKDSSITKGDMLNQIDLSEASNASISPAHYELLSRHFYDKKYYDSLSRVIGDSLKRYTGSRTDASILSNPYEDDNEFDPWAEGEDNIMMTTSESSQDYTSFAGNMVTYNFRTRYTFPKIKKALISVIPVRYNSYYMANPQPEFSGSTYAFLEGNNIGALEVPYPAATNLWGSNYTINGSSIGELLEKRTIIKTSDGKTSVRAGINVPGAEVGAEISDGITITESTNNIMTYQYNCNFKLEFQPAMDPYFPKPSLTGKAWYSGSIVN